MTMLEPLGLIFLIESDCLLYVLLLKWLHKTPISKYLINLDGLGSSENFKAQHLGKENVGIVMCYRGTKTINPSGLFEKFT